MAKKKTFYICQKCGAQSAKWIGKCPHCNTWDSYAESVVSDSGSTKVRSVSQFEAALPIDEIKTNTIQRIVTNSTEFNRVLGGGLVPGSVVLIGGEPGIGKSTLLLQIALNMKQKVLYISGEESIEQIKLRANRLHAQENNCLVAGEILLENIVQHIENNKPELVVIDSIQTIYTEKTDSSPGTVSQIRDCTSELMQLAKKQNFAVLLVGHINKEGTLAGPKVLEHIVDVVIYFEGDSKFFYRILRPAKNRFGSTAELGIFEMNSKGLKEITNPSEYLLSSENTGLSGISIAACTEGGRSYLIEVQALVSSAIYATPQRSATGFDLRKLNMLLAVLEKRVGFKLATKDVFLNIAGGFKIDEPAIDLSVICSILSSEQDIAIPTNYCFCAEVGLSGEVRPVNQIEQRITEAEKLGFEKIFISSSNKINNKAKFNIEILLIRKVDDILNHLF
ncbi:MAG: DNA repair protein RadA [Bacteroidia bacterium]|nr:MAG: DNA repair protein RadA [Bacteroidia bacterium]